MATPGPDDLAHFASSPKWADVLREVPREHFIPDAAWANPVGPDPGYWIDRTADSDQWRAAVYNDTVIITQLDDGATDLTADSVEHAPSFAFTSSNSAPSNVAAFLELLDPYPGDRVLEIGTGTGWTAALLCHRLGSDQVTTVEVDASLADQAQSNLKPAGHSPRVVVTDGADGWPDAAPYDRVHVTCGVHQIPYAWVAQTRLGGTLAVPWMPGHGGHKVTLTVTGERAVGGFRGDCGYMMLRSQRPAPTDIPDDDRESISRVDPRRVTSAGPGFQVGLMGMLPGVTAAGGTGGDGTFLLVVSDRAASHARATYDSEHGRTGVVQRGPRNLWDEVERAYLRWVGWGQPSRERFGLTVEREGQHVWLDTPDNRIPPMEG